MRSRALLFTVRSWFEDRNLRGQVLRGSLWLVVGNFAAKTASIGKLAVLGRLLTPNDFGLMGIAVLIVRWLERFTETGFNNALVRKRGQIEPYLDTAWTVQSVRGVAIALTLIIGAPVGARFFGQPDSAWIIRAVAMTTLLRSVMNPAVLHLRRQLNFQPIVMCDIVGALTGVVSAIAIAVVYRNAWALVVAALAAQAASTVVSYIVEPYRPRWTLDWAKAHELRSFGKWIFWLNVAVFLSENVDGLAVAKIIGTRALGLYQVAYQLALFPSAQLRPVVVAVMLPAFTKLTETNDLPRAFVKTLALVTAVLAPASCFITVFAEPLVRWALGDQWGSITPTMRVLPWAGVFLGLTAVTIPLFQAMGRPEIPTRAFALRVVLSAILLYPLTVAYDILGAAIAVTVAGIGAFGYELTLAARVLKVSPRTLAKGFGIAASACLPFFTALAFLPSPNLLVVIPLAMGTVTASVGIASLSFGFSFPTGRG